MILEEVHDGNLTMDQVLELDYNELMDKLGRQIVASRPRCATLGLGTLKAAVKKYQRDRRLDEAGIERPATPDRHRPHLRRGRRRSSKEGIEP